MRGDCSWEETGDFCLIEKMEKSSEIEDQQEATDNVRQRMMAAPVEGGGVEGEGRHPSSDESGSEADRSKEDDGRDDVVSFKGRLSLRSTRKDFCRSLTNVLSIASGGGGGSSSTGRRDSEAADARVPRYQAVPSVATEANATASGGAFARGDASDSFGEVRYTTSSNGTRSPVGDTSESELSYQSSGDSFTCKKGEPLAERPPATLRAIPPVAAASATVAAAATPSSEIEEQTHLQEAGRSAAARGEGPPVGIVATAVVGAALAHQHQLDQASLKLSRNPPGDQVAELSSQRGWVLEPKNATAGAAGSGTVWRRRVDATERSRTGSNISLVPPFSSCSAAGAEAAAGSSPQTEPQQQETSNVEKQQLIKGQEDSIERAAAAAAAENSARVGGLGSLSEELDPTSHVMSRRSFCSRRSTTGGGGGAGDGACESLTNDCKEPGSLKLKSFGRDAGGGEYEEEAVDTGVTRSAAGTTDEDEEEETASFPEKSKRLLFPFYWILSNCFCCLTPGLWRSNGCLPERCKRRPCARYTLLVLLALLVLLMVFLPIFFSLILPHIITSYVRGGNVKVLSTAMQKVRPDGFEATVAVEFLTSVPVNAHVSDIDVQVHFQQQHIGRTAMAPFKLTPQSNRALLVSDFFVEHLPAWEKFVSHMFSRGTSQWELDGSCTVSFLGLTYRNIPLRKVLDVEGPTLGSGADGATPFVVREIDMGDSSPSKIIARAVVDYENTSSSSVESIGQVTFSMFYNGYPVGVLTSVAPIGMKHGMNTYIFQASISSEDAARALQTPAGAAAAARYTEALQSPDTERRQTSSSSEPAQNTGHQRRLAAVHIPPGDSTDPNSSSGSSNSDDRVLDAARGGSVRSHSSEAGLVNEEETAAGVVQRGDEDDETGSSLSGVHRRAFLNALSELTAAALSGDAAANVVCVGMSSSEPLFATALQSLSMDSDVAGIFAETEEDETRGIKSTKKSLPRKRGNPKSSAFFKGMRFHQFALSPPATLQEGRPNDADVVAILTIRFLNPLGHAHPFTVRKVSMKAALRHNALDGSVLGYVNGQLTPRGLPQVVPSLDAPFTKLPPAAEGVSSSSTAEGAASSAAHDGEGRQHPFSREKKYNYPDDIVESETEKATAREVLPSRVYEGSEATSALISEEEAFWNAVKAESPEDVLRRQPDEEQRTKGQEKEKEENKKERVSLASNRTSKRSPDLRKKASPDRGTSKERKPVGKDGRRLAADDGAGEAAEHEEEDAKEGEKTTKNRTTGDGGKLPHASVMDIVFEMKGRLQVEDDGEAFTAFMREMATQERVPIAFTETHAQLVLETGVGELHVKDVRLDGVEELEGMSNMQNVQVRRFGVLGELNGGRTWLLETHVSFPSNSPTSVVIGDLGMRLAFEGVELGWMAGRDVRIQAGDSNTVRFIGLLQPPLHAEKTISRFFSAALGDDEQDTDEDIIAAAAEQGPPPTTEQELVEMMRAASSEVLDGGQRATRRPEEEKPDMVRETQKDAGAEEGEQTLVMRRKKKERKKIQVTVTSEAVRRVRDILRDAAEAAAAQAIGTPQTGGTAAEGGVMTQVMAMLEEQREEEGKDKRVIPWIAKGLENMRLEVPCPSIGSASNMIKLITMPKMQLDLNRSAEQQREDEEEGTAQRRHRGGESVRLTGMVELIVNNPLGTRLIPHIETVEMNVLLLAALSAPEATVVPTPSGRFRPVSGAPLLTAAEAAAAGGGDAVRRKVPLGRLQAVLPGVVVTPLSPAAACARMNDAEAAGAAAATAEEEERRTVLRNEICAGSGETAAGAAGDSPSQEDDGVGVSFSAGEKSEEMLLLLQVPLDASLELLGNGENFSDFVVKVFESDSTSITFSGEAACHLQTGFGNIYVKGIDVTSAVQVKGLSRLEGSKVTSLTIEGVGSIKEFITKQRGKATAAATAAQASKEDDPSSLTKSSSAALLAPYSSSSPPATLAESPTDAAAARHSSDVRRLSQSNNADDEAAAQSGLQSLTDTHHPTEESSIGAAPLTAASVAPGTAWGGAPVGGARRRPGVQTISWGRITSQAAAAAEAEALARGVFKNRDADGPGSTGTPETESPQMECVARRERAAAVAASSDSGDMWRCDTAAAENEKGLLLSLEVEMHNRGQASIALGCLDVDLYHLEVRVGRISSTTCDVSLHSGVNKLSFSGGIILSPETATAVSSVFGRSMRHEGLDVRTQMISCEGTAASTRPQWLLRAVNRVQLMPEIPPLKELLPGVEVSSLLEDFDLREVVILDVDNDADSTAGRCMFPFLSSSISLRRSSSKSSVFSSRSPSFSHFYRPGVSEDYRSSQQNDMEYVPLNAAAVDGTRVPLGTPWMHSPRQEQQQQQVTERHDTAATASAFSAEDKLTIPLLPSFFSATTEPPKATSSPRRPDAAAAAAAVSGETTTQRDGAANEEEPGVGSRRRLAATPGRKQQGEENPSDVSAATSEERMTATAGPPAQAAAEEENSEEGQASTDSVIVATTPTAESQLSIQPHAEANITEDAVASPSSRSASDHSAAVGAAAAALDDWSPDYRAHVDSWIDATGEGGGEGRAESIASSGSGETSWSWSRSSAGTAVPLKKREFFPSASSSRSGFESSVSSSDGGEGITPCDDACAAPGYAGDISSISAASLPSPRRGSFAAAASSKRSRKERTVSWVLNDRVAWRPPLDAREAGARIAALSIATAEERRVARPVHPRSRTAAVSHTRDVEDTSRDDEKYGLAYDDELGSTSNTADNSSGSRSFEFPCPRFFFNAVSDVHARHPFGQALVPMQVTAIAFDAIIYSGTAPQQEQQHDEQQQQQALRPIGTLSVPLTYVRRPEEAGSDETAATHDSGSADDSTSSGSAARYDSAATFGSPAYGLIGRLRRRRLSSERRDAAGGRDGGQETAEGAAGGDDDDEAERREDEATAATAVARTGEDRMDFSLKVTSAVLRLDDGGEELGAAIATFLRNPTGGFPLYMKGGAGVMLNIGDGLASLYIDDIDVDRDFMLGSSRERPRGGEGVGTTMLFDTALQSFEFLSLASPNGGMMFAATATMHNSMPVSMTLPPLLFSLEYEDVPMGFVWTDERVNMLAYPDVTQIKLKGHLVHQKEPRGTEKLQKLAESILSDDSSGPPVSPSTVANLDATADDAAIGAAGGERRSARPLITVKPHLDKDLLQLYLDDYWRWSPLSDRSARAAAAAEMREVGRHSDVEDDEDRNARVAAEEWPLWLRRALEALEVHAPVESEKLFPSKDFVKHVEIRKNTVYVKGGPADAIEIDAEVLLLLENPFEGQQRGSPGVRDMAQHHRSFEGEDEPTPTLDTSIAVAFTEGVIPTFTLQSLQVTADIGTPQPSSLGDIPTTTSQQRPGDDGGAARSSSSRSVRNPFAVLRTPVLQFAAQQNLGDARASHISSGESSSGREAGDAAAAAAARAGPPARGLSATDDEGAAGGAAAGGAAAAAAEAGATAAEAGTAGGADERRGAGPTRVPLEMRGTGLAGDGVGGAQNAGTTGTSSTPDGEAGAYYRWIWDTGEQETSNNGKSGNKAPFAAATRKRRAGTTFLFPDPVPDALIEEARMWQLPEMPSSSTSGSSRFSAGVYSHGHGLTCVPVELFELQQQAQGEDIHLRVFRPFVEARRRYEDARAQEGNATYELQEEVLQYDDNQVPEKERPARRREHTKKLLRLTKRVMRAKRQLARAEHRLREEARHKHEMSRRTCVMRVPFHGRLRVIDEAAFTRFALDNVRRPTTQDTSSLPAPDTAAAPESAGGESAAAGGGSGIEEGGAGVVAVEGSAAVVVRTPLGTMKILHVAVRQQLQFAQVQSLVETASSGVRMLNFQIHQIVFGEQGLRGAMDRIVFAATVALGGEALPIEETATTPREDDDDDDDDDDEDGEEAPAEDSTRLEVHAGTLSLELVMQDQVVGDIRVRDVIVAGGGGGSGSIRRNSSSGGGVREEASSRRERTESADALSPPALHLQGSLQDFSIHRGTSQSKLLQLMQSAVSGSTLPLSLRCKKEQEPRRPKWLRDVIDSMQIKPALTGLMSSLALVEKLQLSNVQIRVLTRNSLGIEAEVVALAHNPLSNSTVQVELEEFAAEVRLYRPRQEPERKNAGNLLERRGAPPLPPLVVPLEYLPGAQQPQQHEEEEGSEDEQQEVLLGVLHLAKRRVDPGQHQERSATADLLQFNVPLSHGKYGDQLQLEGDGHAFGTFLRRVVNADIPLRAGAAASVTESEPVRGGAATAAATASETEGMIRYEARVNALVKTSFGPLQLENFPFSSTVNILDTLMPAEHHAARHPQEQQQQQTEQEEQRQQHAQATTGDRTAVKGRGLVSGVTFEVHSLRFVEDDSSAAATDDAAAADRTAAADGTAEAAGEKTAAAVLQHVKAAARAAAAATEERERGATHLHTVPRSGVEFAADVGLRLQMDVGLSLGSLLFSLEVPTAQYQQQHVDGVQGSAGAALPVRRRLGEEEEWRRRERDGGRGERARAAEGRPDRRDAPEDQETVRLGWLMLPSMTVSAGEETLLHARGFILPAAHDLPLISRFFSECVRGERPHVIVRGVAAMLPGISEKEVAAIATAAVARPGSVDAATAAAAAASLQGTTRWLQDVIQSLVIAAPVPKSMRSFVSDSFSNLQMRRLSLSAVSPAVRGRDDRVAIGASVTAKLGSPLGPKSPLLLQHVSVDINLMRRKDPPTQTEVLHQQQEQQQPETQQAPGTTKTLDGDVIPGSSRRRRLAVGGGEVKDLEAEEADSAVIEEEGDDENLELVGSISLASLPFRQSGQILEAQIEEAVLSFHDLGDVFSRLALELMNTGETISLHVRGSAAVVVDTALGRLQLQGLPLAVRVPVKGMAIFDENAMGTLAHGALENLRVWDIDSDEWEDGVAASAAADDPTAGPETTVAKRTRREGEEEGDGAFHLATRLTLRNDNDVYVALGDMVFEVSYAGGAIAAIVVPDFRMVPGDNDLHLEGVVKPTGIAAFSELASSFFIRRRYTLGVRGLGGGEDETHSPVEKEEQEAEAAESATASVGGARKKGSSRSRRRDTQQMSTEDSAARPTTRTASSRSNYTNFFGDSSPRPSEAAVIAVRRCGVTSRPPRWLRLVLRRVQFSVPIEGSSSSDSSSSNSDTTSSASSPDEKFSVSNLVREVQIISVDVDFSHAHDPVIGGQIRVFYDMPPNFHVKHTVLSMSSTLTLIHESKDHGDRPIGSLVVRDVRPTFSGAAAYQKKEVHADEESEGEREEDAGKPPRQLGGTEETQQPCKQQQKPGKSAGLRKVFAKRSSPSEPSSSVHSISSSPSVAAGMEVDSDILDAQQPPSLSSSLSSLESATDSSGGKPRTREQLKKWASAFKKQSATSADSASASTEDEAPKKGTKKLWKNIFSKKPAAAEEAWDGSSSHRTGKRQTPKTQEGGEEDSVSGMGRRSSALSSMSTEAETPAAVAKGTSRLQRGLSRMKEWSAKHSFSSKKGKKDGRSRRLAAAYDSEEDSDKETEQQDLASAARGASAGRYRGEDSSSRDTDSSDEASHTPYEKRLRGRRFWPSKSESDASGAYAATAYSVPPLPPIPEEEGRDTLESGSGHAAAAASHASAAAGGAGRAREAVPPSPMTYSGARRRRGQTSPEEGGKRSAKLEFTMGGVVLSVPVGSEVAMSEMLTEMVQSKGLMTVRVVGTADLIIRTAVGNISLEAVPVKLNQNFKCIGGLGDGQAQQFFRMSNFGVSRGTPEALYTSADLQLYMPEPVKQYSVTLGTVRLEMFMPVTEQQRSQLADFQLLHPEGQKLLSPHKDLGWIIKLGTIVVDNLAVPSHAQREEALRRDGKELTTVGTAILLPPLHNVDGDEISLGVRLLMSNFMNGVQTPLLVKGYPGSSDNPILAGFFRGVEVGINLAGTPTKLVRQVKIMNLQNFSIRAQTEFVNPMKVPIQLYRVNFAPSLGGKQLPPLVIDKRDNPDILPPQQVSLSSPVLMPLGPEMFLGVLGYLRDRFLNQPGGRIEARGTVEVGIQDYHVTLDLHVKDLNVGH